MIAAHQAVADDLAACVPLTELARLGPGPGCRASYRLSTGEELCLSREQWQEWIRASESHPSCGRWSGRWTASSPFRDLDSDPPKAPVLRFQSQSLPGTARTQARERLRLAVERWRERVSEALVGSDPLGVFRQLLLGERIKDDPSGILLELGFVSVICATGLHLLALAALVSAGAGRVASALGLRLRVARLLRFVITVLAWGAAWTLSGARAGMLRPIGVIALRALARSLGFRWRRFSPLLIALALELAAGMIAGVHWLQALLVGIAIIAAEDGPGSRLRMVAAAWAAISLADAWRAHLVSPLGPFLEVSLLPVICFAGYPALLAASLSGSAALISTLSRALSSILVPLVAMVIRFGPFWMVPRWALLLGAALGALSSAAPALGLRRSWSAVLVAAIFAWRWAPAAGPDLPGPRATRVEQLDVGQGDSALVLGPGKHAGLIDTGSEHGLGDRLWIELLAERGIDSLDWIALTHLDEDHSGGTLRLAKLIPTGCVAVPRGELASPRGKLFAREAEALGVSVLPLGMPCVPFPARDPAAFAEARAGPRRAKANENMAAYLIPLSPSGYYLSAGDADRKDEPPIGRWAASLMDPRDAGPRFLKISHHGSTTSSDPGFIREFAPDEAWISSGVGNHFGHPARETLRELAELGIPVRRTDREGALATAAGVRRRR